MSHTFHNIGVAQQIGPYSDAVEIAPNQRMLFSAGTPGLTPEGDLPEGITAQAEVLWDNVIAILEKADMGIEDLVKVTTYLTRDEDKQAYAAVRTRVLGEHKPAFMLAVVPHLIRPGMLVEVEIIAAKPA